MSRKGFTPSRKVGSNYNPSGQNAYRTGNGYATAIFKGDPVVLSAGVINRADGTTAIGVARGFFYIDANGTPKFANQLPASTSSGGSYDGVNSPIVFVDDDPNSTFTIPSDATISAADVGSYYNVSIGAGSTFSGISGARVHVSSKSATSTDRLVKVVGLHKVPGNNFDAASTIVEVRFVNHQNRS
jgi:hypothetical protein